MIRHRATARLSAVTIALVLLAGGLSGLGMLLDGDATRGLTVARTEAGNALGALIDGSAAAAFDRWLEDEHPFRRPALEAVAAARYLLLRQAQEGAIVGQDGWLFTTEELERHPGDGQRLRQRVAWMAERVAELEARGTEVVVVLLPAKARLAADTLPRRLRPLATDERYAQGLQQLRAAGVTVADTAAVLGAQHFFMRDTHWRPDGASRVADLVAQTLAWRGEAAFGTDDGEPLSLTGDLTTFLPLPGWLSAPHLEPEGYREVLGRGSAGGGLFDTPDIPVALVGTSYSADDRWGFAAFLRSTLAADVLNVAEKGAGPFEPLQDYLSSQTAVEIPPRVLVWEVPERYLTLPDYVLPAVDGARS